MKGFPIKQVDALIGRGVLGSVLLVWMVLTGFDAVLVLLRQLSHVGQHDYGISNAVMYLFATLPRRLYQMFPDAALIGSLLGLGALASRGELTILRAVGMSPMQVAVRVASVIAVLLLMVMLLGETVGPWGEKQAQAMLLRMQSNDLDLTKGAGLWARDGDHIINAKSSMLLQSHRHHSVVLVDVRVFTLTPDGQIKRFDHADTAAHDGRQWALNNVRTTMLDHKGIHSSEHVRIMWNSHLSPRILEQSLIQPRYLSLRDLYHNMRYLERHGSIAASYVTAFWDRLLYPINVLVLVFCVTPFAFSSLRSGGLGKRIVIGILLAIGWRFLQQAMVSFGSVYGLSAFVSGVLPVISLPILSVLYFRRHA